MIGNITKNGTSGGIAGQVWQSAAGFVTAGLGGLDRYISGARDRLPVWLQPLVRPARNWSSGDFVLIKKPAGLDVDDEALGLGKIRSKDGDVCQIEQVER